MRILDYQKPNPSYYGQPKKKRLFDRFSAPRVGAATMPQGMSREDMPLQAPPPMPDMPRQQSGAIKPPYAQRGDQLLGLGGMFKSVPIPDRVGDQQRRRWQQEMDIQESGWGRDGGPSIDDTPSRLPNDRTEPFYPADMNATNEDAFTNRQRGRGRNRHKRYRTD